MVLRGREQGFTVAEMIVTLVVMGVFLTLLFQMYMTGVTQQGAVTQRAAANDIALTNLKKIVARTSSLLSSISCGSSNDLTSDVNAAGTSITFTGESLTGTGLPSSTTQTLTAFYPRGCSSMMPIQIVSTVNYGSTASDKVTYASYVN